MKNKFAFSFALMLALAAAFLPACAWFAFTADPLYDSPFSPSLGTLPAMKGGRVMPVSSAAADVLKSLGGSVKARTSGGKISASKWLWQLSADSRKFSGEKLLRTDNRELQKILGANGRYFSYDDLANNYEKVADAANGGDSKLAKAAQAALERGMEYALASNTFAQKTPDENSAVKQIRDWQAALSAASAEIADAKKDGREPDRKKLAPADAIFKYLKNADAFETAYPDRVVNAVKTDSAFVTPTHAMLERGAPELSRKHAEIYAEICDALAANDEPAARAVLEKARTLLQSSGGINRTRLFVETFSNIFEPFTGGFILYAAALVFFGFAGLITSRADALKTMGGVFAAGAVALHIAGIVLRMYIQMRPPVTNLYSSIVFAGAVAAAIGVGIYFSRKYVSAVVAACAAGAASLVVAMNLPYSGDTMGMMRAVLNSNFWLTAHVSTIMVGYCGIFLAGFIAQARLVANLFSRENFGAATGAVSRTVFALLGFALLFTFAGTMLGGIWADMSWGRFWGWDPKENGALMTVLWTASAVHLKAARLCSDRFFLGFAVLGNIVAAWAWFGVNLLGIGMHSYGFTDGGWIWLGAFVALQLVVFPLCFLKFRGTGNAKK